MSAMSITFMTMFALFGIILNSTLTPLPTTPAYSYGEAGMTLIVPIIPAFEGEVLKDMDHYCHNMYLFYGIRKSRCLCFDHCENQHLLKLVGVEGDVTFKEYLKLYKCIEACFNIAPKKKGGRKLSRKERVTDD